MEPLRGGVVQLVSRIDQRRWWVAAALIGVGLGAAWVLALSSGSLTAVSRHWFYLPVVFAAVRFGLPGAALTGTLAGLLAGPAVFTLEGAASAYGVWGTRGAFFLVVGLFVAGLVAAVRTSQRQSAQLAEQQLRLADQRAAVIQTVSHEFRTPLTVLRGGIQSLEDHHDEIAERLHPLIAGLGRAERRLGEMVSVVLATADAMDASQQLEAEPVRVTPMVESVAASLERLDGPGRVVVDVDADAEVVVTVPGYLQLALRCVIDNALRFSPDHRPVTVSVARQGDTVAFEVHDHGPGIDPGFASEAFDAFTQADGTMRRTHGGLGIGLFAARNTVERLGGSVRIVGTDTSQGTTISIQLPQRRDADRAGRRRRRTGDARATRHHRVSDTGQAATGSTSRR